MKDFMHGSAGRAWLIAGAAALGIAACGDLLEVEDPSRFTDEALNTPLALRAVANGVEGDMHLAHDTYVIFSALLADEYMHTGTWGQYDDVSIGRIRAEGIGNDGGLQASYLQTRLAAQKAMERFRTVMGDTAERSPLLAQVKAVEGWTNLLMGQLNCEGPLEPGGVAVSDSAMIAAAIPLLTEALTLASSAGDAARTYGDFARAGRARANLLSGNYDAALADAQALPMSFEYLAQFSVATGGQNNLVYDNTHRDRRKAAGVRNVLWARIDTLRGFYLDPATGDPDPRVPIVHRGGTRGVDGVKLHYSAEKYTALDDDIAMTHGPEMRLIEAEVYWRKGDFATAIARINAVRAAAGLDPIQNPGTSQGVFDALINERFAQLFLEGQRAHDLYRFGLVRSVLGADRATKFALDNNEIIRNDNIPDAVPGRCPAIS
jgi:hypothetical protein